MNVEHVIEKLYGTVKDESLMRKWMAVWFKRYQGRFRTTEYVRVNSGKKRREKRYQLMSSKMVCEAKSQLLVNEKWKLLIEGNEVAQTTLDKVLSDNRFYRQINEFYELVSCLGVGAIFESKGRNGIEIKFINGFNIYPISVLNDKIIECAFVNENWLKGKKVYQITAHVIDNEGNYVIKNTVWDISTDKEIPVDSFGIQKEQRCGKSPTFQIFTPTSINHIDLNSAFGVSIFSTALDVIDTIDDIYTSMNWEYRIGKKRVLVSSKVMKPVFEDDTKVTTVFDADDAIYLELGQSDEPFVKEIDFSLRIDEHTKGINANLNYLSQRCGFGNSYFSYDGMYSKPKTATEVASKNQELIASVQRDRLGIEDSFYEMGQAILEMAEIEIDKNKLTQTWDDSIFEDESKQRTDVMLLFREGKVDPIWALGKLFKLTEEEAKKISTMSLDDQLKQAQLMLLKKTGSMTREIKTEETDIEYKDRDKPDPQYVDDDNDGI